MNHSVIVLKFGSSILADESALPAVVSEIYRVVRGGQRVLAVVSAMGSTTDDLLASAHRIASEPSPQFLARLLATGEATSAALLGMALDKAGISSTVLEASCLATRGPILDAAPVGFDVERVEEIFEHASVAVLPGFVGHNERGELCLLGRGGSDLTALFVASCIDADDCVLVKDVPGLFERDPAQAGPAPRRFRSLSHEDSLQLNSGVVQPKALRFAARLKLPFRVAALGEESCTRVGALATEFDAPLVSEPLPKLRVALLGLGSVGGGVYERLQSDLERFEIATILVRDRERRLAEGIPSALLAQSADDIFQAQPDVLVELIGGIEPARSILSEALRRGISVVSAGKAVLAEHGNELVAQAVLSGARLEYSASVGGAVPALEAIRRLAHQDEVRAFDGVLNGTSGFVLDRLARGVELDEALREARALGLAEADPTMDLDGTDVAHKLVLMAREAFGDAPIHWVQRSGLKDDSIAAIEAAAKRGEVVKLLGHCELSERGIVARVGLCALPFEHPLAALRAEENGVLIESRSGRQELWTGKGAGRWPTTESVIADLQEILRAQQESLSSSARAS